MLQPLEHFVRFLAQCIHLSDLAGAGVGVFVDQFFQGRVGLRPVAIGKVGQRQCVDAPERIGFLFREFHRRSGFAAQNLNNRKLLIVVVGLRLQFDGLAHRRLGLVVAAERDEIRARGYGGIRRVTARARSPAVRARPLRRAGRVWPAVGEFAVTRGILRREL